MSMEKYDVNADSIRPSTSPQAYAGSVLISGRVASFYEQVLSARACGRLADLGCGTSPFRDFYVPLVESAWSVDWPSSVHDVRLDAHVDLTAGIPFRDASLDTIVVSDVMEHLPEPSAFLDECSRILRPGGTLIGNVPFAYWLHEEPHDYYRYTEYGIRHLLARAGFDDVSVHVLGGGPDVVFDIAGKAISILPGIGSWLARRLQRACLRLFPSPGLHQPTRRSSRKFPLAYGVVATRSLVPKRSSSDLVELP